MNAETPPEQPSPLEASDAGPPGRDSEPLVRGSVEHARSGVPLANVRVEALVDAGAGEVVLGGAATAADGSFVLWVDDTPEAKRHAGALEYDPEARLSCRALDTDGYELARGYVDDGDGGPTGSVVLSIETAAGPDEDTYRLLATTLSSARTVRVGDVARAVASPSLDSPLRLLPIAVRSALLDGLAEAVEGAALLDDDRLLDLSELGGGTFVPAPGRFGPNPWTLDPTPDFQWPIWGEIPGTRPDDESYRDYLRGVFVLYAHQQAVGFAGNVTQWTAIVEEQLRTRFFQDFKTQDRTNVPLNTLVIPIVTEILKAPTGTGFGFGVPAAGIPAQGTLSPRAHLDALLALAPIDVEELASRYRLPLDEPDSAMSSRVLLNVYTLKRVLSDTAQGPVEPRENVIAPPLPGFPERTILWDVVVGAAPFFLRFEEWLDRQKPFYPENLFSLRTQIQGHFHGGPWLDETTKKFLEYHANVTITTATPYGSHFGSVDEGRRSARFLLAVGAADAKLFELLVALDRQEYAKAMRLAGEAWTLLRAANPAPAAGEDWSPIQTPGSSWPRSYSFARRRNLQVKTIAHLASEETYYKKGLERFFLMPRLGPDLWYDASGNDWPLRNFVEARALATRLVRYQRGFLLPILEALCLLELGDHAGAVVRLGRITGFYVGTADAGTPAGAAYNSNYATQLRAVHQHGTLPYTARLTHQDGFLRDPEPFSKQLTSMWDPPAELGPTDLHRVEERYVRLVQADAMLRWGDVLYRSDDPSSLERARELYKGVVFLHGEEPGTSAYESVFFFPFFSQDNPRRHAQLERARLALLQLDAGLNYYGYRDDLVPTLRYRTLLDAATRWSSGAKAAQNDFLAYMSRLEQADLDILAARAQQRKAQAQVQIAAEQVEIAKAGVVAAQRLVKDVEKRIEDKKKEIEDADSILGQYKAYFTGMKDSISSLVDVGKAAHSGASATGIATEEEMKVAVKGLGKDALAGTGAGGLAVVGAMGTFAVLSYVTLDGMAEAAMKRSGELTALMNDALPAAHAVVRVHERQTKIAELQGVIATTELAYARDLIAYHGERFLNRDFWSALAGVARQSMRRQLDLAAQAAWFAERALAYEIGRPVRIVRLDYFDPRLRDVTGVDRLLLDLAELEAVRLGAAHLTVPIRRTYSLARDFPLAYGALKRSGRCRFSVSESDLVRAYPGTFSHRLRAVTTAVEAPGAAVPPRGMLSNRGLSFVRREPGAPSLPLVRFEDALPVSEFRLRDDMAVYEMPGELLMPFEGSGFETMWELELPAAANPSGLARLTDVLVTFDVRARYRGGEPAAAPTPATASRALFASGLALDTAGFSTLRGPGTIAKVQFPLSRISFPGAAQTPKITNVAVLLPGVENGSVKARLRPASGPAATFSILDGLALSNHAHLSDGVPGNAHALNVMANTAAAQGFELELRRTGVTKLLKAARDVVLWLEYEHTV